jgi:hypothetical protein
MDLTHPNVLPIPSDGCNCPQLHRASRGVTRLYDDALAPIGLGANQYSILAQLNHAGPSAIGFEPYGVMPRALGVAGTTTR